MKTDSKFKPVLYISVLGNIVAMPNQHILIVTSNPELSHLLADKILRPLEYQVTLAKNTQIAETSFRSFPPDLVILDIGIDDENGLNFAKELVQHLPIVPLILVGSDDRTASMEMAYQFGAAG